MNESLFSRDNKYFVKECLRDSNFSNDCGNFLNQHQQHLNKNIGLENEERTHEMIDDRSNKK